MKGQTLRCSEIEHMKDAVNDRHVGYMRLHCSVATTSDITSSLKYAVTDTTIQLRALAFLL